MLYKIVVSLYVLFVFGYLLTHGVFALVSHAIKEERDVDRIHAMPDLSDASYPAMLWTLLTIFVFGLAAAFLNMESKAVFAWVKHETERPPSARDIFETYRASRAETLRKLESLPLSNWWRTGKHKEFGIVTLRQQVSYFTAHESTHLSQINALAR